MESEKQFRTIFNNKGNIGPIAEKAKRNFDLILKNEHSKTERIYHFCIGHTFKNIDKSIFESKLNENLKKFQPTKYITLQKDFFTFETELYELIKRIRDCNSHYVHTFDKLSEENIEKSDKIIPFIKDAFQFSIISNYIKENNLSFEKFNENENSHKEIVKSIINKFFPNGEMQKNVRDKFSKLNLKEVIDELLFITVDEDFEYNLIENHPIFTIKKGKYLSNIAHLFILSLFLYKNEANQLISKIRGFKRNDDEFHHKRDIFTFFSKKLTSQDINNEEKNLINFRDIIQYLNKYPTAWNKNIEPERQFTTMTNSLEKYVIETEIFRSFPTFKGKEEHNYFLKYVITNLFKKKKHLFDLDEYKISKELEVKLHQEYYLSPELKDANFRLDQLKNKKNTNSFEEEKIEEEIEELSEKENSILEKLKKRIKENKLLMSYGRNQDRFMEIALRFLAENNYFGKNAKFKLYQFYTTDEQIDYLAKAKKEKTKKEYDKIKYHQGKVVDYVTYKEHLKKYPDWDFPFAIQNNSIQIKIQLTNKEWKLFSIQRKLFIYLLEDALYGNDKKIDNRGNILLSNYFLSNLIPEFNQLKNSLADDIITTEHRKLFPKRLLAKYQEPIRNNTEQYNPFLEILVETKKQENRYDNLFKKSKELGLEDEFQKKNKGKQFKLRFLHKAWNLMYFRKIYDKQVEENGHHKRFNITKEEFNDFCRWIFAFDEVTEYKKYLEQLFTEKRFFDDEDFKTLFFSSDSLNEMYNKTKENFGLWINGRYKKKERKGDYEKLLAKDIIYINISHFINYLKQKKKITIENELIKYSASENIPFLINSFYYKEILPKDEYKENGKLFNELRTTKLEDALLYEIAMQYLKLDKTIINKAKENVTKILTSTIEFDIKDANNKHLYNLVVPFSKIENLAVLFKLISNSKDTFLTKIYTSTKLLFPELEYEKEESDNKKIRENLLEKKELSFESLNAINNLIISSSVKVSKVFMALEKYFIIKIDTKIPYGKDYVNVYDIHLDNNNTFENEYNENDTRNNVAHFDIPKINYDIFIKNIEAKFITNEIKPLKAKSFEDLNQNIKDVCSIFLNILHSNLYPRGKGNKKTEMEQKYFNQSLK
ncbi:hypothetical protein [Chishuiella sp.]|uniref:hypothetical protein n=1 Tax=Chishuiella sp. TaxID=1969467 RepID=UPI0028B0FD71|nr:hypothetical protein [Chishuiella sp.]